MDPKCFKRSIILFPILILSAVMAGCSREAGTFSRNQDTNNWSRLLFSWKGKDKIEHKGNYAPGTYPVDPLFTDFYLAMGGEDTLGPAISPARYFDSYTGQYTESSLMVYDPTQSMSTRFKLAPLGVDLGVKEGNQIGRVNAAGRIINGYFVGAEFLEVYEDLGGARFVGRPISEAIYNSDKQRLEQYFENLGFYQLSGQTKIHLLPYGAYSCNRNCRQPETIAAIPSRQPILPDSFLRKTLEIGLPFVGKPLTGLHIAADGKQEVVFENLVLVADPESPELVDVRSITESVGKQSQNLTIPQTSALNVFVEIENGLGFNVPVYFVEYLESFGGMGIAGQPISEVFSPEPGLYVQCFTNLCLQFNLNAEGDQRLSPLPLGDEYKQREYELARDFYASQQLGTIEIKVWEDKTFVASSDYQEIHVAIFEEGKPLQNFEPLLIATMPDGSQRKAYLQPSDEYGRSSIKLAPIDAPNGSLIAYRVCLFGIDESQICVGDNYLIWDAE